MVSMDRIERGIAKYLDTEFMPQLRSGGFERVLVGTAASLMIRKVGMIAASYKDNKLVKMTGIIDEKGDVDVEAIAAELKNNITNEGVKIDIPVIGTVIFHKEDVDKLRSYIMEV